MEKYLGVKQFLGFIIIICGSIWVLNTIGLLGSLLLGIDSFTSYFTDSVYIDGEEKSPISFTGWKLLFWSTIISATLLKILGGSFSKINGNGYKRD
jgi:hypothetical protein